MSYRSKHFELLDLVHAFSRLPVYGGAMPSRLLVLDADLVEEMVRNRLLEKKRLNPSRTMLSQDGVALTQIGRRLVDLPR